MMLCASSPNYVVHVCVCAVVGHRVAKDSMTSFDDHIGRMKNAKRTKKIAGVDARISIAQVSRSRLSRESNCCLMSYALCLMSYVSHIYKLRTPPLCKVMLTDAAKMMVALQGLNAKAFVF